MIGVMDSGLGGVNTAMVLRKKLPGTSFLVLADQKNAPYGEKSPEEIRKCFDDGVSWLKEQGVHSIVVACNTMCSNALEEEKGKFPDLSFTGILDCAIRGLRKEPVASLIVAATPSTIASGAYQDRIRHMYPNAQIYAVSASRIVPILEGSRDEKELRKCWEEYLRPYRGKARQILLACTHYPLCRGQIEEILPGVKVIDPNDALAEEAAFPEEKSPHLEIATTGDPEVTEEQIRSLYGRDVKVRKAVLHG